MLLVPATPGVAGTAAADEIHAETGQFDAGDSGPTGDGVFTGEDDDGSGTTIEPTFGVWESEKGNLLLERFYQLSNSRAVQKSVLQ